MAGIFYGIGVGPGDPDLLTVKAVKTINKVDAVIAPKSGEAGSTALAIARPHLKKDVELVNLVFPMAGKQEDWREAWRENKKVIGGLLQEGKDVAFLTLGDPMFFSTYIYVFRLLQEEGHTIETVSGVPAFCAAAGRAGFPLVEGDEVLSIVPATADQAMIENAMRSFNNLVLMKVSRDTDSLLAMLARHGFSRNAVLVSRCGLPGEDIVHGLPEGGGKVNYLSTILARRDR